MELVEEDFTMRRKKTVITHPVFQHTKGMILVKNNWCGHCIRFMPTFHQMANITGVAYPMAIVDGDSNPDALKMLNVQGFPSLYIVDNGVVTGEYSGGRQMDDLWKAICLHSKQFCRN